MILTIDLNIIKNNYKQLAKLCPNSEVGAAVKANCYGLGVEKIAPVLEKIGCRHFFVANSNEGVFLRTLLLERNSNIYVLNGDFIKEKQEFFQHKLTPVLNSLAQVKDWEEITLKLSKKLPCAIHFNTGMNRLGIHNSEIHDLQKHDLNIILIMSHLSSSEEKDNPANEEQLALFNESCIYWPNIKKSLSNSSGIFLGNKYHLDVIRPGAALYGINPAPYLSEVLVKNPITLTVPIIQIHHKSSGEYVGYNRTYKLAPGAIIATLPLGYADGYMRSLSNKGIVYINGKPAQVIGRISMDLITIDVTYIPAEDLFLGQRVEIIGPNISPDKIASLAGTNAYEILTILGNRYNRIYS